MSRKNSNKRLGATAVEFAMTAPLLFLLVFAGIEFARINSIRHTIDNASYEGARVGITPDGNVDDIKAAALKIMAAVGAKGTAVETIPSVITPDTKEITVIVTTPVDGNGFVAPTFFSGSILRGSTTLFREEL